MSESVTTWQCKGKSNTPYFWIFEDSDQAVAQQRFAS